MLITEHVTLKWARRGIKHYTKKGYVFTKINDEFVVNVEDLNQSCKQKVEVICDNEECDNRVVKSIQYSNYAKYVENRGKYYCKTCANVLFGIPNREKIRLDKGVSFGQFLIDTYGEESIDLYWSDLNSITPFDIIHCSNKFVYIKCTIDNTHPDYKTNCNNFKNGNRCPYCASKYVTENENLGLYLQNKNILHLYSNQNNKSPFEYRIKSNKKVYWKCHNGVHDDYLKRIADAIKCGYFCTNCNGSLGEMKISNYLNSKNINFEQQIKYDGLRGINGGLLSYDFYLPDYNLLLEFQGEQHIKFKIGFHNHISDFERQQEHDKRKKEYATKHNIKLLEIFYNEFDKVEEILQTYLLN
jgi:hypothetical protein